MIVLCYLIAVIAANLSVTMFGPAVSVLNAFLFIGFDLTTRDTLHEHWQGKHLWARMLLLITTGSALSAIINVNASNIAIASFFGFLGSGLADTLTYGLLNHKARFFRVNGSNMVGAALDSVIFPALAFGFPLLVPIMVGQFVAKVAGGFVWSVLLMRVRPATTKI